MDRERHLETRSAWLHGLPISARRASFVGLVIGILTVPMEIRAQPEPSRWSDSPSGAAAPPPASSRPATSATDTFETPERDTTQHVRVKATDNPAATQGQVWKEYDLRSYLRRVRGLENPQGAIIEWILRETGTSQWFGEVPGMLAVEADILRVYHIPAVQEKVAEIVDRFVNPNLSDMTVSVRLITIESTSWRGLAMPVMTPVKVQTPGIEAWLIRKEDAALLSANLRQRVDFREHSSASLQIAHGQSHTIERWIPRTYAQSVIPTPGRYPGYQINQGQLQEGYTLTISPLAHTDQELMDVVVKCGADQIEKTSTFTTDVMDINGQKARVPLEVPQLSSWRVHERFRWPTDQLLIVSRGVVAVPGARQASLSPIPNVFPTGPARADAILIFECRQATGSAVNQDSPESRVSRLNYHGRY